MGCPKFGRTARSILWWQILVGSWILRILPTPSALIRRLWRLFPLLRVSRCAWPLVTMMRRIPPYLLPAASMFLQSPVAARARAAMRTPTRCLLGNTPRSCRQPRRPDQTGSIWRQSLAAKSAGDEVEASVLSNRTGSRSSVLMIPGSIARRLDVLQIPGALRVDAVPFDRRPGPWKEAEQGGKPSRWRRCRGCFPGSSAIRASSAGSEGSPRLPAYTGRRRP